MNAFNTQINPLGILTNVQKMNIIITIIIIITIKYESSALYRFSSNEYYDFSKNKCAVRGIIIIIIHAITNIYHHWYHHNSHLCYDHHCHHGHYHWDHQDHQHHQPNGHRTAVKHIFSSFTLSIGHFGTLTNPVRADPKWWWRWLDDWRVSNGDSQPSGWNSGQLATIWQLLTTLSNSCQLQTTSDNQT